MRAIARLVGGQRMFLKFVRYLNYTINSSIGRKVVFFMELRIVTINNTRIRIRNLASLVHTVPRAAYPAGLQQGSLFALFMGAIVPVHRIITSID